MKQFAKTQLGVTLLEVMLVLAVAAMVIVMSIRYYQSANSSQQSNSVLAQVQAIVAAGEQLSQSTGSYKESLGETPEKALEPLLPKNAFTTPWGASIDLANVAASSYDITLKGTPSGVCPLVMSKLKTNNHFVFGGGATCDSSKATDLAFSYVANA